MILIANSVEKVPKIDGVEDHTTVFCSFSEESTFKFQEEIETSSSKIDSHFLKGKDFAAMRNFAVSQFFKKAERKFIYVNAAMKTATLVATLKLLLNMEDGFLFTKEGKIIGFIFHRDLIKKLGGYNYLSQLLIRKNKESDEDSSLLVSNEALDYDYLYRYVKYKELVATTEKKEIELSKEELINKEKFDKDPLFYRSSIEGVKASDYYMLYMNSIAAFKSKIKHTEDIIKEYAKVFRRLKRDSLSERVKAAQKSFVLGFLYHNPIYYNLEGGI